MCLSWRPGRELNTALPLTRRLHLRNASGALWCWQGGSNTRPPLYENGALPTELCQRRDKSNDGAGSAERRGLMGAPITCTAPSSNTLDVHDEKQPGAEAPNHARDFENSRTLSGGRMVTGEPLGIRDVSNAARS